MASKTPPDPVFIGGTGRSGTHAVARLLNRHPHYRAIPAEVRFHSDPPGLPGLLAGEVALDEFLARLRGPWWESTHSDGAARGLSRHIPPETFDGAVTAFERDFAADPNTASAKLVRTLLDPFAAEVGKPSWVEHTNKNVASGATLLRVFPEAKIIHTLRDGRDVAASLVEQSFGPSSLNKALKWWEERLALTERGAAELPAERLLTIRFEDLFARNRDAGYERVIEFLELEDVDDVRWFFSRRLRTEKANVGRGREQSERARRRLTRRYRAALERLIAADTPARPLLESALAETEAEG